MPTLKQEFEQQTLSKQNLAPDLIKNWRARLTLECPEQSETNRESIIRWLVGKSLANSEILNPDHLAVAQSLIEQRYYSLQAHYLKVSSQQAYQHLTIYLASLILRRNTIRHLFVGKRDRQQMLMDILQAVLLELLQSSYMQRQITWIAKCTADSRLRNALLLSSLEEYCLRPIRNQPLFIYKIIKHIHRKHHTE